MKVDKLRSDYIHEYNERVALEQSLIKKSAVIVKLNTHIAKKLKHFRAKMDKEFPRIMNNTQYGLANKVTTSSLLIRKGTGEAGRTLQHQEGNKVHRVHADLGRDFPIPSRRRERQAQALHEAERALSD